MGPFTIELYEDSNGSRPVEDWVEHDLTDVEVAALLAAVEHVLSHSGIGVCGTEWGKQLGEGLFEFRVRHTASEIRRMFANEAPEHKEAGKVLLRSSATLMGPRSSFYSTVTIKGPTPARSANATRSP